MPSKIQLRRGTTAQWTAANPTLAEGEIGMDTSVGRLKVGDGLTAWNSLDYYDLDLDQAVAAALPETYGADDQFVTESVMADAIAAVGPQYGAMTVQVVAAATLKPANHVQYVCANDIELLEPDITSGELFHCGIRMSTGAMVTYPAGWFLGGYCPSDKPYVVELTSADGTTIHAQVIPFEYTSGSGASVDESIKVAAWGDDANDGTTWASAKRTVDAGAVTAAAAGKQLWIGTGTYDAPADAGFTLTGAVEVYGGFQGDEETLAERPRTAPVDGRGCSTYTYPTVLRNRVLDRPAAIAVLSLKETTVVGLGQGPVFNGLSILDSVRVTSGEGSMFVDCLISGMAAPGQNGVLADSILFGCTVAGNTAGTGGGLYNCSASNCRITGNTATLHGGGARGGVFVNCLIDGNSVASGSVDGHGGGLYGAVSASDCTISGNTLVKGNGAGAFDCDRISSCLVTGNTAQNGSGGGLSNCDIVTDCTVSGNVARYASGGGRGGGLNDCGMVYRTLIRGNTSYCSAFAGAGCQGVSAQYFSCTIMENVSRHYSTGVISGYGGGALDGLFHGCWFVGNQSSTGAGISLSSDGARLYNCVFWRNHCTEAIYGSPVSALHSTNGSAQAVNCTFLHNQCVGGTGTKYTSLGSITMYNCLFWRNNGEADGTTGTKANNKVEADLALTDFEDPADWPTGLVGFPYQFDDLVRAGCYRPAAVSVLLDAGDSTKNPTTTDVLGLPRKVGTIDIGAFERQA